MPTAYSVDMRVRILHDCRNGMKYKDAATTSNTQNTKNESPKKRLIRSNVARPNTGEAMRKINRPVSPRFRWCLDNTDSDENWDIFLYQTLRTRRCEVRRDGTWLGSAGQRRKHHSSK